MTDRNYLENMPVELTGYYQDACREYEKQGVFFLEENYILFLQEKCNVFPRICSDLILAAKQFSQDRQTALIVFCTCRVSLLRLTITALIFWLKTPLQP